MTIFVCTKVKTAGSIFRVAIIRRKKLIPSRPPCYKDSVGKPVPMHGVGHNLCCPWTLPYLCCAKAVWPRKARPYNKLRTFHGSCKKYFANSSMLAIPQPLPFPVLFPVLTPAVFLLRWNHYHITSFGTGSIHVRSLFHQSIASNLPAGRRRTFKSRRS